MCVGEGERRGQMSWLVVGVDVAGNPSNALPLPSALGNVRQDPFKGPLGSGTLLAEMAEINPAGRHPVMYPVVQPAPRKG